MLRTCLLACVALALCCSAVQAGESGLKTGTPELKSIGPLAFGPENVLFISDPLGAAVVAVKIEDDPAGSAARVNIDGINDKVAALLGVTAKDVLINDLAVNPASGSVEAYPVIDIISHIDAVILRLTISGEVLETTPNHPFRASDGAWTAAEDLQAGDLVLNINGQLGQVEAVEWVEDTNQRMYNLVVAEAHSFFVGSGAWLVAG